MADLEYPFDDGTLQGWTIFQNSSYVSIGVLSAAALGGSANGLRAEVLSTQGTASGGIRRTLPIAFTGEINVQFRFRIASGSDLGWGDTDGFANILSIAHEDQYSILGELRAHSNGTTWNLADSLGSAVSGPLQYDTDYIGEARFVCSATAGGFQVRLNDALVMDDLTHNTGTTHIHFLQLGLISWVGADPAAGTIFDFDEIKINSTYIGIPSSGVSAAAALVQESHQISVAAQVGIVPVSAAAALVQATHIFAASALVPGKIIDHTNFDPSSRSDAEIAAAAALKVYFEHASVGQDIVGDSDTTSAAGVNHDASLDCGLHLLYDSAPRYVCDRLSLSSSNDYAWFATHGGLQDNHRGNPGAAVKISGFQALSTNMLAAVDVAMFKFCYIDTPADGAALASAVISAISAMAAANPGVVIPHWTMPIETVSYAERQAYNDAIRVYCQTNGKWLLDIAAIESHNDSGAAQVDGNGREILYAGYTSDGGHLNAAGALKMARAYWSLLAGIVAESAPAAVTAAAALNQAAHVLSAAAVVSPVPVVCESGLTQAAHMFSASAFVAPVQVSATALLVQQAHILRSANGSAPASLSFRIPHGIREFVITRGSK